MKLNNQDICWPRMSYAVSSATAHHISDQTRIDPLTLPLHSHNNQAPVYYLDHKRAVLKRRLCSGLALTVQVDIATFKMVAVRLVPESAGEENEARISARLELIHCDETLNLVLATAEEPEALAEDWAMWGHILGLPLRLIDLDGQEIEPPEHMPEHMEDPVQDHVFLRRRGNPLMKRRTRFQTRRKIGRLCHPNVQKFSPNSEIIARN